LIINNSDRLIISDRLCPLIFSRRKEGERKGGYILLPVGAGEFKESYLPLGWSL